MNDMLEELIGAIRGSQKQLVAALEKLEGQQDWQPEPNDWSFRFIAAHLATTEKECYQDRVVRIAAGEHPHFLSYFNNGRDFSQLDLKESLRAWQATRQAIIDLVRALPAEKLALTGTHEVFGSLSVADVLKLMRDHDQEHLSDMEKMIEKFAQSRS